MELGSDWLVRVFVFLFVVPSLFGFGFGFGRRIVRGFEHVIYEI